MRSPCGSPLCQERQTKNVSATLVSADPSRKKSENKSISFPAESTAANQKFKTPRSRRRQGTKAPPTALRKTLSNKLFKKHQPPPQPSHRDLVPFSAPPFSASYCSSRRRGSGGLFFWPSCGRRYYSNVRSSLLPKSLPAPPPKCHPLVSLSRTRRATTAPLALPPSR